ncbi:MAG TPA: YfhO family protein [Candidatus Saccharimonadales bacterium]|nr:YfhO family protein [Candidatus Saccharimonadales bacterium]
MDTLKQRVRQLVRHRFFPPVLVIIFILGANGLYLTNHYLANPAYLRSGLISGQQPGPISGQYTIDPSDGFYAQALGHRAAVDLSHGHMPWWNHYEGIGAPLIGGLQSGALFPLEFLLVFPNGLFYFHLALEIICGIATYYFLRRLRCNKAAAIAGASAFAINGTFAWIAHTIFNPIAFLPVLLLGIEFIREHTRDGKRRGWILLALGVSCTLYAGFPETGFIDMMFVACWALVRMTTLPRRVWLRYIGKLAGAAIAGLALASPLLLAFAEYLPHANVGLHAGNTAHLVVPHIGLAGLILPYIFGPIFAFWGYDVSLGLYSWWAVVGGFLAIALVPLVIVGVAARSFRRIDRYFLLGWIVFCVLASYGLLGFNEIVGHIPILSSAAWSRYFPPTYEFAAVALAAMALTYVWDRRTEATRILRLTGIATGLSVAGVAAAAVIAWHEYHVLAHSHAPHLRIFYYGSILWGLAIVLLIGAGLLLSRRRVLRYGVIAVLLLDVTVMYAIPMFSAPRHASLDYTPVNYLRANLGEQRMFSLGPIQPNYGSYYRTASANINDVPQPKTYSAYITSKLDSNVNAITFTGTNSADGKLIQPPEAFLKNMANYEAIGVKYVITFPELFTKAQVQSHNLKLVFHSQVSEIYLLPNPKPFVSTIAGACTTRTSGFDAVIAHCSKASTLLRLEQYFPGWTATVDGKPTTIGKYQGLMQTVAVPAGKHTVQFHFEPPHVKLTYLVVALTLAVMGFEYCLPEMVRNRMWSELANLAWQPWIHE